MEKESPDQINENHFRYYKQKIELDIYIITSYLLMLLLPCLLLFLSYIFQIIFDLVTCSSEMPNLQNKQEESSKIKKLKFLFISIAFSIVVVISIALCIFPGIFVIVTQFYCILFLKDIQNDDQSSLEANSLEILLVCILIFMVSQEISQAINTLFYLTNLLYKSIKSDVIIDLKGWRRIRPYIFIAFSGISFLFPLIQTCVVVLLLNISVLVILQCTGTLDLIQNFAGLYIILEFDNLVLKFMDIFPWKSLIFEILNVKFLKGFSSEKILRSICLDTKQLIKTLEEDEIELNFKKEFQNYEWHLISAKILIIMGSLAYALADYYD